MCCHDRPLIGAKLISSPFFTSFHSTPHSLAFTTTICYTTISFHVQIVILPSAQSSRLSSLSLGVLSVSISAVVDVVARSTVKSSSNFNETIDLGKMFGQLNWMIYLVLMMVYYGNSALAMSVFLGMNLCDSVQSGRSGC